MIIITNTVRNICAASSSRNSGGRSSIVNEINNALTERNAWHYSFVAAANMAGAFSINNQSRRRRNRAKYGPVQFALIRSPTTHHLFGHFWLKLARSRPGVERKPSSVFVSGVARMRAWHCIAGEKEMTRRAHRASNNRLALSAVIVRIVSISNEM